MKIRLLAIPLALAGVVFGQSSTTTTAPPQPPDPTVRMQQMLTRMLQLDSGQQSQVGQILADLKIANQGLGDQLSTARKSLIAAIKTNDTGQIHQLTVNISGVEQQLSENRSKAASSIYAILTDSQRNVVGAGLGMLMGGGGPMGPGGPGGFGGRGPGGRNGPPPAAPAQNQ
jgi:Spy/CpxP family protein refolding chaperone